MADPVALASTRSELRPPGLRRGLKLAYFTLAWNLLEALVGFVAGIAAGSVALVGFALDSLVESSSAGVVVWRIRAETAGAPAETVEKRAVRLVAAAFFALALYVGGRSIYSLVAGDRPDESVPGIALAAVSLIVMPLLARAKRRTARDLGSRSLQADSTQTYLCTYLSALLLVGLMLNAGFGWWWADPLAALGIAGYAAKEGLELWRNEDPCCR